MGKLLDEEKFWELYWDLKRNGNDVKESFLRKNSFGKKILKYTCVNYHDYLLWDVIYKKYMPKIKGAKVLEIGSAPGNHLVKLNQVFGFVPYGVEHSEHGVKINRGIFNLYNINPDNVIHADFFSKGFQKKYAGFFDVVISRGFIEDFSSVDVKDIVEKHINLLIKGGYLFISIPNIRGLYYIWARLFEKKLLSEMNLGIMQKEKFAKLFDEKDILSLFCNYYGTFCCNGRFSSKINPTIRFVLNLFNNLQRILNIVFRVILKDKGLETSFFSPYLLFIGIKK